MYIHAYICIFIYIHMCIYLFIHHVYLYAYIFTYTNIYTCIRIRIMYVFTLKHVHLPKMHTLICRDVKYCRKRSLFVFVFLQIIWAYRYSTTSKKTFCICSLVDFSTKRALHIRERVLHTQKNSRHSAKENDLTVLDASSVL